MLLILIECCHFQSRVPIAARPTFVRQMSGHGGAKPDGVFRQRTLFQAWCLDTGVCAIFLFVKTLNVMEDCLI
jgi:hypothetical protein